MTYDMPSIVEATGLSAVTRLATNPPSHPTTTTLETGALPLVLYIARVPGSRDVFLTPIKPREKVVTAEDVSSSLYYVHVNTVDDYQQTEPPAQRLSSANADASQLLGMNGIAKKIPPPLPKRPAPPVSPPYPVDDAMPAFRARPISLQQPQHVTRTHVLPDTTNTSPTRQPGLDLPAIPRRPLPTPPEEPPTLHDENVRLLRQSEHMDETNNPYSVDYQNHPETLKVLEEEARPDPGTLTLIRRDPGSSEQWNVASIHDPPVQEVSSSALLVPTAKRRTKKGGAPLYLDITNPGYVQFIAPPERSESRISTSTSSSDTEPPRGGEGMFRRRLYMPGSRFGEHGYSPAAPGHRKYLSVSSASSGEEMLRKSMRDRHSVDLGSIGGPKTATDPRSKAYTFTSPWDGRCEFVTGATGKTLKCRHYLPAGGGRGGMEEVSELRFNLPTSSRNTPYTVTEKRSSYFTHRPQHLFSSRSEDGGGARNERSNGGDGGHSTPTIVVDEDGRIDLSLGQEKAGGGFGGKQAKLGKLIVEPSGLRMLDLLVAANVGLWWRAYERI